MAVKNSYPLGYYPQLDGLRCFAVVAVMIQHWISWDTPIYFFKNVPWGHGVILFFVLSGYLISNVLFAVKEDVEAKRTDLKSALKTFYLRRVFRIFPAYYAVVLFLAAINYQNTREILPWLLTFSSNILECVKGDFVGNFNHFWSLAVEEQFYILWPLLIFLVPQKRVLRLIVGLMLVSLISRTLCFLCFDNWMLTSYFTLNLFFPLCLGALMAYAKRYHAGLNSFFSSYFFMWLFLLAYVGFFYVHTMFTKQEFMIAVLDEFAFSWAIAFVIYRAANKGFRFIPGFVLSHDAVVYAGKISYSMYLYHLFIISLYWGYLAPRFQIDIHNIHTVWAFYFMIIFFLGSFSYYLVEAPFNKIKDKFSYWASPRPE